MTTKTISAWEARRNFGKLMDEVAQKNRTIIIESHGEAKVAVVPLRVAERDERARQLLVDALKSISERIDLPEDETMEIVNAEIEAYRAERRRERGR